MAEGSLQGVATTPVGSGRRHPWHRAQVYSHQPLVVRLHHQC